MPSLPHSLPRAPREQAVKSHKVAKDPNFIQNKFSRSWAAEVPEVSRAEQPTGSWFWWGRGRGQYQSSGSNICVQTGRELIHIKHMCIHTHIKYMSILTHKAHVHTDSHIHTQSTCAYWHIHTNHMYVLTPHTKTPNINTAPYMHKACTIYLNNSCCAIYTTHTYKKTHTLKPHTHIYLYMTCTYHITYTHGQYTPSMDYIDTHTHTHTQHLEVNLRTKIPKCIRKASLTMKVRSPLKDKFTP